MKNPVIALLVLTITLFFIQTAAAEDSYVYSAQWGSYGTGSGQFANPYGIAIDDSDAIYIADNANNRVEAFTSDGKYLGQWGSFGYGDGQFRGLVGIAVDHSGYILVSDYLGNRVQKFTSDGTFLSKFGSAGTGDGQFDHAAGIAIDSKGDIYVVDEFNHRVQKFSPDGKFLLTFGSYGSDNGQMIYPSGIAIDSADNVYIGDDHNYRIQKFTPDGRFLLKFGTHGATDGQFGLGMGDLAVDPAGNIIVTDAALNRVQVFSPDGTFLLKFGSAGAGNGQFNRAVAVAVDSAGNVYVSDYENHRIQKFIRSPSLLTQNPAGNNGAATPGYTVIPLCRAGSPFDSSKYAQDVPYSAPMVFSCSWNGKGRVYISGDPSDISGIYADDGFTVSIQPSGTTFDAPEHYAHRHPVVELTSGMRPGMNTLTITVRNWQGLSMSYGKIAESGWQTPYIVQAIQNDMPGSETTPEPVLTPTTGILNGNFEHGFTGWTQAGWVIDETHGSAGDGSKSAAVHGSSGPAYLAQSAYMTAPATIRYWYSRSELTTGDLIVSLDGREVRRFTGSGGGSGKWLMDEIPVTSSGTHTIAFTINGYSSWTNIDDITIAGSDDPLESLFSDPVPEPLSPFAVIGGLAIAGLVFAMMRRR